jgi:hypothetical protein
MTRAGGVAQDVWGEVGVAADVEAGSLGEGGEHAVGAARREPAAATVKEHRR